MQRHLAILKLLAAHFKKPLFLQKLRSASPFKIAVAVLLSARAKDIQTAAVAKRIFLKYPNARALAAAQLQQLRKELAPLGLYKIKAARLRAFALELLKRHKGKVPSQLGQLLALPGIGRKSANCILSLAFGKPALAVDSHVLRISNRLGLVKTSNPLKAELALKRLFPKRYWSSINPLLVALGQSFCFPRKPNCSACPLSALCPKNLAVL